LGGADFSRVQRLFELREESEMVGGVSIGFVIEELLNGVLQELPPL
jgi:hypothetical protein